MLWGLVAAVTVAALCVVAWRIAKRPVYEASTSIRLVRVLDATGPGAAEATRLLNESKLAELRTMLARSVDEHRTSAAAQYNLGVACEADGDLVEAREHYSEALRLDPKHQDALKALDWCREALESLSTRGEGGEEKVRRR